MKLKNYHPEDLPREKLLRFGAMHLSDAELLALLVGSGIPGKNALELSSEILRHFGGLSGLIGISYDEISQIKGVGQCKATRVLALSELFSRCTSRRKRPTLEEAIATLEHDLPAVEEAYVLCLSTHEKVTCTRLVGKGAEAIVNVSRKEILRRVLLAGAKRFVFVHIHPSGIPLPSKEDMEWTYQMAAEAEAIGISFTDHMILAPEGKYSFAKNGLSSPIATRG